MIDEGMMFSREEVESVVDQANSLLICTTTASPGSKLSSPSADPVAEEDAASMLSPPLRDMRASRLSIQGPSNPEEQNFFLESLGIAKLK